MGYRIPLRDMAGMLTGWQGTALDVITLASQVSVSRIDLTLNDIDPADVIVSVTDGTTPVQLTIPTGDRYASAGVAAVWPQAAVISQTIVQGSTGMNLGGSLYVEAATTPGSPGPGLITLVELKLALGLTSTTAEQDAYLQRQIDASSARIRNYLGHHLAPTQSYQDVWYKPWKALTAAPYVQTVDNVNDDGSDLDLTELIWDPPSGRIWRPDPSIAKDWTGTNQLTIDYTAGFADTPIEVKELMYGGIQQRWSAWLGGTLAGEPGAVKKVVFADVGSTEYAGATSSGFPATYATDPVTGFSLSSLDDYRDVSKTNGAPNETRIWEVVVP